jgi:hypothetical protein
MITVSENQPLRRPDVIDWGIVGENAALRQINTSDPVDMDRYWETDRSIAAGLMVDDFETRDELKENAQINGRSLGFTFAISGISGREVGELQGFVQFTSDRRDEFRRKIEETGLFGFLRGVSIWEVSYAKYPQAAPRQVASAVRQACVLLLRKIKGGGVYPRVAIIGCVGPDENPESLRVLASACFVPIGSTAENPRGIIQYEEHAKSLDSVWLLNWNALGHKLRERAAPELERRFKAV